MSASTEVTGASAAQAGRSPAQPTPSAEPAARLTTTAPTPGSVPYLPVDPASGSTRIALVGCGGISGWHLAAYRSAGYQVVALCDLVRERAEERQREFFPDADIHTEVQALLQRDDVDVVDIATHVDVRPALVRQALDAGKHVLSQKPFVRDIDEGRALVAHAAERGLLLAANQNGRWAPHFSYLLSAIRTGLIGEVLSADFWVYWPHDEVVASNAVFSTMTDLILFDYGIHWFDLVAQVFAGRPAREVTARVATVPTAVIGVPTNAQATIEFDDAQASITFRGSSHLQEWAGYRVEGTEGVLTYDSSDYLGASTVTVTTAAGTETLALEGSWFANGMHGSMAELLRALEEGRSPSNGAATALPGLQLCYAALRSARERSTVDPSTVTAG